MSLNEKPARVRAIEALRSDVTREAIADLRAVFTNAYEATAAIKELATELAVNGVDISQLYEAANNLGVVATARSRMN